MKTIGRILVLGAIIASIGVGCKPNNPPTGQACSGQATIDGIVTNEDGDSLNGIRIDVYYDEQLLEHFPSQEKYDWWDTVSIEHKQKYPFDNPIHYTNYDGKAGYYRVSTVAIVKPNKHPIINTCYILLPFETPTTPARTCIMH